MVLHRIIGILSGVVLILVFTGQVDWFSVFNQAQRMAILPDAPMSVKARSGHWILYAIGFLSVMCLVFPKLVKRVWHSYGVYYREPFLTEGVWICLGYLLTLVSYGVLFCF